MKIGIVGGGPSGLMCAYVCAQNETYQVVLFNSNEKLGKKLYITGKGRCNVTNYVDESEFLKNVVRNEKFLYSALNSFSPKDTIDFFNSNNTMLKVERGNRVFPISDKASDITKTFEKLLKKENVTIKLNTKIFDIKKEDDVFILKTNNSEFKFDILVLATGGKSYPSTGSTGDGYKFASCFGHSIITPVPGLVSIKLKDYKGSLSGLSLKNVSVSVKKDKEIISKFGEMLFTHSGVSGPVVLSISSFINRLDIKNAKLVIDLKPGLDIKQLDNRLLRDFEKFKLKSIKNYLKEFLPNSLINEFLGKLSFRQDIRLCDLTKEMRYDIVLLLKNFSYEIKSLGDFNEAIITSGGVDVKEINPKTMESKKVKNLFIVGELLDVDALTGGFNIQIALSTGFLAGKYIAQK